MTPDPNLKAKIERIEEIVSELKAKIGNLEKVLGELKDQYTEEVTANLKTWNGTADNVQKVVWIIIGAVIVSLLAVIGLN